MDPNRNLDRFFALQNKEFKHYMKNLFLTLTATAPISLLAQSKNFMYSEGKIYVVIAVIAVIFLGLAGYLYRMDRKISALENEK
jgi:CcmD family protein